MWAHWLIDPWFDIMVCWFRLGLMHTGYFMDSFFINKILNIFENGRFEARLFENRTSEKPDVLKNRMFRTFWNWTFETVTKVFKNNRSEVNESWEVIERRCCSKCPRWAGESTGKVQTTVVTIRKANTEGRKHKFKEKYKKEKHC